MDIVATKQRFGIIGNAPALNHAIEVALLIAPTDVSVLITGESGVGKETFPQIIHQNSARKHGTYITVNCGAIPEGTIDSELFGHVKGSFTDAVADRKGYFEVADGGTIFLDEVGELPLSTQARLLRVLESGEYMKVGSSQVQRTNIRIVAATNVDLNEAIKKQRFREDLYYRLNTVSIELPPLRERGEDIALLFRKFASDFADKYHMPPVRLDDGGKQVLLSYAWPGNVRQLRNIVERLSVIVEDRTVTSEVLMMHLPKNAMVKHPVVIQRTISSGAASGPSVEPQESLPHSSLEILYKMIYDLKGEVAELSRLLRAHLAPEAAIHAYTSPRSLPMPSSLLSAESLHYTEPVAAVRIDPPQPSSAETLSEYEEIFGDKILSLEEMEHTYIQWVLKRNNGARKKTAEDLNISERTLYRKLKENEPE